MSVAPTILDSFRCYPGCESLNIPAGNDIRFAGPGNESCIGAVSALNTELGTTTLICASKQGYSDWCVDDDDYNQKM